MSCSIRDATLFDRDSIISFDHVAHREPQRVAFIDHALREEICLVTERRGRVVAYAVLEYAFFGNGFISMLYVAEEERRRGIGHALLEALARRCRTQKLFTSTNQSNQAMQRLVEKLGFEPSGIIYNLDPGDPELLFFMDTGRSAG